jgi:hemerythrin superfamily protein
LDKESARGSLLEHIKKVSVDSEQRLVAIAKHKEEQAKHRASDPMSGIFSQIKQIQPKSDSRLAAIEEAERNRRVLLEGNKKVPPIALAHTEGCR